MNGILTTEQQAGIDKDALKTLFNGLSKRSDVDFEVGYNQTHAAGLGDELKSVAQTYLTAGGASFSDYDLQSILMQLASQIHTQKILLVGHSQGTFYTNAMYDYLIKHGVSPSAITVYNLATPATHVAGGGAYTTSSYDKAIEYIRELDAKANAPQPLPANINIPIPYAEKDDEWAGHHFQSDYLEGAPGQIVRDMQTLLARLQSSGTDTSGSCFEPPAQTLSYQASAAAFAALDSAARTGQSTASAVASAAQSMQSAAGNAIASAWYSVVPRPSLDAAFASMHVVGATAGTGVDLQSETWNEYEADAKADAAAAAARAAAAEEALRNAPRVEVYKPKSQQMAQAGAAALAFDAPADAIEETPLAPVTYLSEPRSATPYQAGFGGGGGGGASVPAPATVAVSTPAAVPAPTPPNIALTSPDDETTFATTSVTFTGTATADAAVSVLGDASGTTAANSAGDWSLTLTLGAGTSTLSFKATKDGLDSALVSRTVGVALPPPGTPVVSAPACAYSLSSIGCILPVSSTTISWSNGGNTESYDIYVNGVYQKNETGTSTSVNLTANATSSIEVVALNLLRDAATSSALQIVSLTHPLRINEIAWAGTVASADDQWMELLNSSGYALDMSRVALASADNAPFFMLSGTVLSYDASQNTGYYLIEHRRDSVATAGGGLAYAFDLLSQTGEELHLEWFDGAATTTIDTTPAVATCSGWCAGTGVHQVGVAIQGISPTWGTQSMERISDDGSLATSWQSNDMYDDRNRDISMDWPNGIILGTPGLANSAGWPDRGLYCGSVLAGTTTLPAGTNCIVLDRFISPRATKFIGFFAGMVGSSTAQGYTSHGVPFKSDITLSGNGMASGDPGFVAVWEERSNVSTDAQNFVDFFTGAATSGPPHTNFATFPWVRQ